MMKSMLNSRQMVRSFYRIMSTVDNSEVKKFSEVGSDWWDKSSSSGTGPLHAMNPCRISFIRTSIADEIGTSMKPALHQIVGLNFLDVGCGGGLLSEGLARLGANMTSIDPSSESITVATTHAQHDPLTSTINFQNTTVEEIAKSGEKFDVVCSLEVI